MNRETVENILAVLKTSTDKNVILKGLVKLRTDLVKDRSGIALFRDAGGIAPMVRFLHKPHEQILEVVLSILGNCCVDGRSCNQAFDCRVNAPLTTILKSIPNSLIQCRACRLLGNLAKANCNLLLASHCSAIVQALIQIIEESVDVQTRIMAFRACRFMLDNNPFRQLFLKADGFRTILDVLTSLLKNSDHMPATTAEELSTASQTATTDTGGLKRNQHRERYFKEVARSLEGVRSDIFDREILESSSTNLYEYSMPMAIPELELINEILKSLIILSEFPINFKAWVEINHRSTYLCPIVFFASESNPYRAISLRILSNLSKNVSAICTLSSADAVFAACELLVCSNMSNPLTESETRHCINLIAILSGDACNRSKIRRSGALRKLLVIAKTSKLPTEIFSILYVLHNFQYDSISMDLMLHEGLHSLLISELNAYIKGSDEYRQKKRDEKRLLSRKRKVPNNFVGYLCKVARAKHEPLFDCESPSSSPRSNVCPSSPCSSRSMSPISGTLLRTMANDGDTEDANSETYSPVCSDEEGDGIESGNEGETSKKTEPQADTSEIMKLLDVASKDEEIIIEDNIDKEYDYEVSSPDITEKLPIRGDTSNNAIEIIENLLFRVTLMENKRAELGKPETLSSIIEAINMFGVSNFFSGSLTNILSESQFFVQMINQGVPHKLYQMTKVDDLKSAGYEFLDTLSGVAKSNYGKAELNRLLVRSDEANQRRAAITVAYLIKELRLLHQFLNDCSALDILLRSILREECDEYTAEAADALTAMCRYTLLITIPKYHCIALYVEESRQNDRELESIESETKPALDTDMRFIVHENGNGNGNEEVLVEFNKKLLCQSSEVFNSMLNGNFREGKEGEIHLKNYTANGLKYFLNLIVQMSKDDDSKANICPADNYLSLLESFEMARIYIIPKMEKLIFNKLVEMLDQTNCQIILEWSMKNYHAALTDIAINYYLCSNLPTSSKVELFRKADHSMYSSEWYQMISDAIMVQCSNFSEMTI